MVTRREIIFSGAAAFAGSSLLVRSGRAEAQDADQGTATLGRSSNLVVPNGEVLPFRIVDGVKIFHLTAEPVEREFSPGLKAQCWGYNGITPGPVIEATEGDRIRIYVTNKLPEPTTVHWHGMIVPNGMDGVAGLTQPAIPVGETYLYEFDLNRAGTYMYHPHFDEMIQIGLGMMGMIVVHPKNDKNPVDYDFVYLLSEWAIKPGLSRPDPTEMTEFNILTLNSRAYPGTAPLVVKRGSRVRVRFGNLSSMDHHPIHFHGLTLNVTETDGGVIPESARWPETTVLVPVGTVRVVEFVPTENGDWPMHCHMIHHIMNQMGHGLPNLIGSKTASYEHQLSKSLPDYMPMGTTGMGDMMQMEVPKNSIPMRGGKGPFGTIDMGGMFTVIKVRENPTESDHSGWFQHPEGTRARAATASELNRDLQK